MRERALRLDPAAVGLGLVIICGLILQLRLLTLLNVNWDEFRFLARIYEVARGEPVSAFQSFYVRLYAWLPFLPGSSVDEIIGGRLVAYLLHVVSLVALWLLGRRMFGGVGALLAVVSSMGLWHVIRHGEAFRADPIIVAAFLTAAVLIVHAGEWTSRWVLPAAGALTGVAVLVSVKAVLLVPTLLVLASLWPRGMGARERIRRLATFACVALSTAAGLFWLHALALPSGNMIGAVEQAGRVGGRVLFTRPYTGALVDTLVFDPAFWVLLLLGASLALAEVIWGPRERRVQGLSVLALMLPLASVGIYRNTFAYFFVVILPPAALACGLVACRVREWLGRWQRLAALSPLLLAIPFVATMWRAHLALGMVDSTSDQRMVLAAIQDAFPQPVAYLDRCSMVSAYPSAGPFMTTYVMDRYRAGELGSIQEAVAREGPAFVLANVDGLELERDWSPTWRSHYRLRRGDFEFLQARYLHHWGPIWVAGTRTSLSPESEVVVALPATGSYRVSALAPVIIGGDTVSPGGTVQLNAGTHRLRSSGGHGVVTLRVVTASKPPSTPFLGRTLFLGLGVRASVSTIAMSPGPMSLREHE